MVIPNKRKYLRQQNDNFQSKRKCLITIKTSNKKYPQQNKKK